MREILREVYCGQRTRGAVCLEKHIRGSHSRASNRNKRIYTVWYSVCTRAAAGHCSGLKKAVWALFAEKLRKGFLRPSQTTGPAGTASPGKMRAKPLTGRTHLCCSRRSVLKLGNDKGLSSKQRVAEKGLQFLPTDTGIARAYLIPGLQSLA